MADRRTAAGRRPSVKRPKKLRPGGPGVDIPIDAARSGGDCSMSTTRVRDPAVPFQGTVVLLHGRTAEAALMAGIRVAFGSQTALRLHVRELPAGLTGRRNPAELAVELAELNPCLILVADEAAREVVSAWRESYPFRHPALYGFASTRDPEGAPVLEDGVPLSAFLGSAAWRDSPAQTRFGVRDGEGIDSVLPVLAALARLAPAEVELLVSYARTAPHASPFGHAALRVGNTVWTSDRLVAASASSGPLVSMPLADYLYGTRTPLDSFEFTDAVGACYGRSVLGLRFPDTPWKARKAACDVPAAIARDFGEGRLVPGSLAARPAALVARMLVATGLVEASRLPPLPLDLLLSALAGAERKGTATLLVHYRRVPGCQTSFPEDRFPWRLLAWWPSETTRRRLETRAELRVEAEGKRARLDTRGYRWDRAVSRPGRCLMTVGPVQLGARVRAAAPPDLSDREPRFSALFEDTTRKLLALAESPHERYQALLLPGTGGAAVEACVASVAALGRLVVLTNGEFGERLASTASLFRPEATTVVESPRRAPLDVAALRRALKTGRGQSVFVLMVHHETSTGQLNDLEEVAAACREGGGALVVDAVGSLGAHSVEAARLGLTLVAGAPHVALGGLAGVSFVLGDRQLFRRLGQSPLHTRYLDLAAHYRWAIEHAQMPSTAPTAAIVALSTALGELLDHGAAEVAADLARRAAHLRRGLMGLGLEFPLEMRHMSSVATPVVLPAGPTAAQLHDALLARGFITQRCQPPDDTNHLLIGHAGAIGIREIDRFLAVLEEELAVLGERDRPR